MVCYTFSQLRKGRNLLNMQLYFILLRNYIWVCRISQGASVNVLFNVRAVGSASKLSQPERILQWKFSSLLLTRFIVPQITKTVRREEMQTPQYSHPSSKVRTAQPCLSTIMHPFPNYSNVYLTACAQQGTEPRVCNHTAETTTYTLQHACVL